MDCRVFTKIVAEMSAHILAGIFEDFLIDVKNGKWLHTCCRPIYRSQDLSQQIVRLFWESFIQVSKKVFFKRSQVSNLTSCPCVALRKAMFLLGSLTASFQWYGGLRVTSVGDKDPGHPEKKILVPVKTRKDLALSARSLQNPISHGHPYRCKLFRLWGSLGRSLFPRPVGRNSVVKFIKHERVDGGQVSLERGYRSKCKRFVREQESSFNISNDKGTQDRSLSWMKVGQMRLAKTNFLSL